MFLQHQIFTGDVVIIARQSERHSQRFFSGFSSSGVYWTVENQTHLAVASRRDVCHICHADLLDINVAA